jgi:hypothetical protein
MPSALTREHPALQKLKFINCFLFLWAIFSLLDPDPDCESGSGYGSTTLQKRRHVSIQACMLLQKVRTQISGSAEKSKHDDRTRPTADYMCTHAAAAVHKHKQPQ